MSSSNGSVSVGGPSSNYLSKLDSTCLRCSIVKSESNHKECMMKLKFDKIGRQVDAFESFITDSEYWNVFSSQLIQNIRKIIASENMNSPTLNPVVDVVPWKRPVDLIPEATPQEVQSRRRTTATASSSSSSAEKKIIKKKSKRKSTSENVNCQATTKRSGNYVPINSNLGKIKIEQDYNPPQVKIEPGSPSSDQQLTLPLSLPKIPQPPLSNQSIANKLFNFSSTDEFRVAVKTSDTVPQSKVDCQRSQLMAANTPKRSPRQLKAQSSYRRIRRNLYLQCKPTVDGATDSCVCKNEEVKCETESCINKSLRTECLPSCGVGCQNRRIQNDEHSSHLEFLEIFTTAKKGFGVKTLKPIRKGEFVLEYLGEIVPTAVFEKRMQNIYAQDTHYYGFGIRNGFVIDARRVGGPGRFINHSCEPNCVMERWNVNDEERLVLFAIRDIEKEEELSYDYKYLFYRPTREQRCYCSSPNCKGVL